MSVFNAFSNVTMNKTKCRMFYYIISLNLLESIKALYKLNSLVACFCQHHWLQCIAGYLFGGGGVRGGLVGGGSTFEVFFESTI